MEVTATVTGRTSFNHARDVDKADYRYILGGQGEDVRKVTLSISSFAESMRNGSVDASTYLFHDVYSSPLMQALPELDDLNDELLVTRHGPRGWTKEQRRQLLSTPALRGAIRSDAYLTLGVDGSGGAFHTHTDALLGLLVGRKHWIISANSQHQTLSEDEFTHSRAREVHTLLSQRGALAAAPHAGGEYWQCVQQPGDALWVPHGLSHTVLNYGETVGVSMQATSLPYNPLIRAAHHGHVEGIRWLVGEGGMNINAPGHERLQIGPRTLSRGDGGTPLHAAVRADHGNDVIDTLADLGANLSARNDNGLPALHVAAGQGLARAAHALLAAGAPIDELDSGRHVPLQYAVHSARSNLLTLEVLLGAGPSVQSFEPTIAVGEKSLLEAWQRAAEAEPGSAQAAAAAADEARIVDSLRLVREAWERAGARDECVGMTHFFETRTIPS